MSTFATGVSMRVTLPPEVVAILEEIHQKQKTLTPEDAAKLSETVMGMPLFIRQCRGEEMRLRQPEKTAEVVPIFPDIPVPVEQTLLQQVG